MTSVHREVRTGILRLLSLAFFGADVGPARAGDGGFAGFEPPALYDLPSPAWSIRSGDLDNDGDVDLVMTHLAGNSVSILFNNGNGTFESGPNMLVAIGMGDSAITDFDGDGIVDIIAVSQGSPVGEPFDNVGRVAILRGLGGGVFDDPDFYMSGFQPVGIAAGDLNGDGHPDFAVTNQLSGDVAVFLNDGDGAPGQPAFYQFGGSPSRIAMADMDRDGDLDVVVLNRASQNLAHLTNQGDGLFSSAVLISSPSFPVDISVVDIEGDEYPEVVIPKGFISGYGGVVIHPNNQGEIGPEVFYNVNANIGRGGLTDVNRDGRPDIAASGLVGVNSTGSIFISIALSVNRFGQFDLPGYVFDLDFFGFLSGQCEADFDADGDNDIALIVSSAPAIVPRVAIVLNEAIATNPSDLTGDGFVNSADLAELLRTWGQAGAADFDNSGAVDGSDLAHILANWDHPPRTAALALRSSELPLAPIVRFTITTDLNDDNRTGFVELLESPASPKRDAHWSIAVWISDGDGPPRLASTRSSELLRRPTDMRLNDVNDDGHLDLLIVDPEAGFLVRFSGVPNKGFDFLATGEPFLTGDAVTVHDAARSLLKHKPTPQEWLRRLASDDETDSND